MLAVIASFVRCLFASRDRLELENLALRHQLAVYQRSVKRPKIRDRDRLIWSMLSRILSGWRELLFIAKPRTVIEWRRRRFRDYWRCLSPVDQLIEAFAWRDTPTYLLRDRDRIHGHDFSKHAKTLGLEELRSGPGKPWQNP